MEFSTNTRTLLFVDDDHDMREFVRNQYKTSFKVVYTAKDGQEALSIMNDKMPDIVVSDIQMPNMNGFDLCKAIKMNLEYSHIPVILLTSRSNPEIRSIGYKLGADAFIPKPFDADELFKMMRSKLWNRFEIKKQYSQSNFSAISVDQTFSAADEKFVMELNKYTSNPQPSSLSDYSMM